MYKDKNNHIKKQKHYINHNTHNLKICLPVLFQRRLVEFFPSVAIELQQNSSWDLATLFQR